MRKSELRKTLAEYQTLSEQITTLEKQRMKTAERIKTAMGEAEELQLDDTVIRYKAITSSRFDAQAFRATYDALYKQFCKPQTTRRFTVA